VFKERATSFNENIEGVAGSQHFEAKVSKKSYFCGDHYSIFLVLFGVSFAVFPPKKIASSAQFTHGVVTPSQAERLAFLNLVPGPFRPKRVS